MVEGVNRSGLTLFRGIAKTWRVVVRIIFAPWCFVIIVSFAGGGFGPGLTALGMLAVMVVLGRRASNLEYRTRGGFRYEGVLARYYKGYYLDIAAVIASVVVMLFLAAALTGVVLEEFGHFKE